MIFVDHPAVFPPVDPAGVVRPVVPRDFSAPTDFREFWWFLHSAVRGPLHPSSPATRQLPERERRDA